MRTGLWLVGWCLISGCFSPEDTKPDITEVADTLSEVDTTPAADTELDSTEPTDTRAKDTSGVDSTEAADTSVSPDTTVATDTGGGCPAQATIEDDFVTWNLVEGETPATLDLQAFLDGTDPSQWTVTTSAGTPIWVKTSNRPLSSNSIIRVFTEQDVPYDAFPVASFDVIITLDGVAGCEHRATVVPEITNVLTTALGYDVLPVATAAAWREDTEQFYLLDGELKKLYVLDATADPPQVQEAGQVDLSGITETLHFRALAVDANYVYVGTTTSVYRYTHTGTRDKLTLPSPIQEHMMLASNGVWLLIGDSGGPTSVLKTGETSIANIGNSDWDGAFHVNSKGADFGFTTYGVFGSATRVWRVRFNNTSAQWEGHDCEASQGVSAHDHNGPLAVWLTTGSMSFAQNDFSACTSRKSISLNTSIGAAAVGLQGTRALAVSRLNATTDPPIVDLNYYDLASSDFNTPLGDGLVDENIDGTSLSKIVVGLGHALIVGSPTGGDRPLLVQL